MTREAYRNIEASLQDYQDRLAGGHQRNAQPARPEFSSVGEVSARLFGSDLLHHKVRVRDLIKSGKIKAVKSGGERSHWWVFNESVDALVKAMKDDAE